MARKKNQNSDADFIGETEPLSNFQDLSKTGRKDARDTDQGVEIEAEELTVRKAIEITSAELVDQMFCNYKYKHTVGPNTYNKVTTKSEVPVHPDLVECFRRLDPHLAVICEEVEAEKISDIDNIPEGDLRDKIMKFTVTSFACDKTDASLKVVLRGLKELTTGEAIKLETPEINVDGDYPFSMQLAETILDCLDEVEEYMKGKQAANPQQELPFGEDEDSYVETDL